METEQIIKITPSGDVICLHDDERDVELRSMLGKQDMVRASDVEWSVEEQLWKVHLKHDDGHVTILTKGFEKRSNAVRAEVTFLNYLLEANMIHPELMF